MDRRVGSVLVINIIGLISLFHLGAYSVAAQSTTTIILDPTVRYQTFNHWEAVSWAKDATTENVTPTECFRREYYLANSAMPNYLNTLLDENVALGINRIRLEVKSGSENGTDWEGQYINRQIRYANYTDDPNNPSDCSDPSPSAQVWRSVRYEIVNDDSNPTSVDTYALQNPTAYNFPGYHFTGLDQKIETMITPLKQKFASLGRPHYITLTYVDFGGSQFEHRNNPSEFAEFILATFLHIQRKYGWVPDAVEVLEPDNALFSATQLGQAFVAAGQRLASFGYRPDFVGPSLSYLNGAVSYFDTFAAATYQSQTPLNYLTEFSYHLYNGNSSSLRQQVLARATSHNLQTSMLEWWYGTAQSTWAALHNDLKIARNSAWEHGTLYGIFDVNDAANPSSPSVTIADKTKYLQHYIRYIKPGAVRISAVTPTCNDNQDDTICTTINPLAFINPDGTYAVIIKTNSVNQAFTISGLPAGLYGITYTYGTTAGQHSLTYPDQTIAQGQSITQSFTNNTRGVMTIYGKSLQPTGPTTPAPNTQGDANGDGHVDGIDYVIWLNHFGQTIPGGAIVGDFNTNGIIDGVDYVLWLNNFGV